ncbi:hypothetical protein F5Y17DRAFT_435461 [Xylariaceae sp. FL0594]|nr:hypothetical protein F5Y17DRAFT_435461 [Xylariaceae sp. FL0594]
MQFLTYRYLPLTFLDVILFSLSLTEAIASGVLCSSGDPCGLLPLVKFQNPKKFFARSLLVTNRGCHFGALLELFSSQPTPCSVLCSHKMYAITIYLSHRNAE